MKIRIGVWTGIGLCLLLVVGPVVAQQPSWRGSPPQGHSPVQPQAGTRANPTLQRRAAPQQPVAPFQLTPQQQAHVNQVLTAWEQQSGQVKTFECNFVRFEYDPVFGPADKPKSVDQGLIKFAAPDKGMFRVDGARPEHWISDGNSIYEFNFQKKQLIEHQLPPELRGKAISDGPLPFIFGAKAEKLKQRYFLRIVTPNDVQGQVWLEAYPRFQQDAANFRRADLILTTHDMQPFALQTHLPNGKSRTVYQFEKISVNSNDLLRFLMGDPFRPRVPIGWQKLVEQAPSSQASRPAQSRSR